MEKQIKELGDLNAKGAAMAGGNATDLYAKGVWLVADLKSSPVTPQLG